MPGRSSELAWELEVGSWELSRMSFFSILLI
jgi:hypothetical protein